MQPDDQNRHTPIPTPRDDTTRVHVPERSRDYSQDAAANIVRGQIRSIYGDTGQPLNTPAENSQPTPPVEQPQQTAAQTPTSPQPVQQPEPKNDAQALKIRETIDNERKEEEEDKNPYLHTHSTDNSTANTAQWQKYHSAWQRYYQEYYSRYYVGELYKKQSELTAHYTPSSATASPAVNSHDTNTLAGFTNTQALNDLRSQLRDQITKNTEKVRGSRHFIPISAAFVVMVIFAFLQFNSIIFAAAYAYRSPGNIEPANVLTNPSTNITVSKNPVLIVPKLNIDVPVDYDATPDNDSQMAAMKNGVAYFGVAGANAKPGQIGNFGIAGHSSNQLFDNGSHKFIFVNLDLLQKGDLIYLNYHGKRYTYSVTQKRVVQPNDVSALTTPTDQPEVTLITCTPSGTALHRLLVTAKQISPSPSGAKKAPQSASDQSGGKVEMPGNSPTLLERIF